MSRSCDSGPPQGLTACCIDLHQRVTCAASSRNKCQSASWFLPHLYSCLLLTAGNAGSNVAGRVLNRSFRHRVPSAGALQFPCHHMSTGVNNYKRRHVVPMMPALSRCRNDGVWPLPSAAAQMLSRVLNQVASERSRKECDKHVNGSTGSCAQPRFDVPTSNVLFISSYLIDAVAIRQRVSI